MKLYGKEIKREEVTRYIGEVSQIADARESVLTQGKAEGVRAIDVKTGGGLRFSVIPSRGLDIAWAEYKGMPLAHIGKSGVVGPQFFEKDGLSFLRGFFCGLMTTCGMTYFGAPCEDEGQPLGLHGRVSNIPAEDVSVKRGWEGDDYVIRISGVVKEGCIFNENLVLTREIVVKMGGKELEVHDKVENQGFVEAPFMLLYHLNFGYPVVSENTVLIEPEGTKVVARDDVCEVEKCFEFETPKDVYPEQVMFHDIPKVCGDETYSALFNKAENLGVYVKFSREQFSHFGQWKLMQSGDYVCGLEPCTWLPLGRAEARKRGELEYIKPGEVRSFDFTIGVLESEDELKNIF